MHDLFKALRSVTQWPSKINRSVLESKIAVWASEQALTYTGPTETTQYNISGTVNGLPWKIERRPASRQFIKGDELMARAVLGLKPETAVIVMNTSLKNILEKQAFSIYTDPVHTLAEQSLTEEMRWLALYPECAQPHLPNDFRQLCVVLAGSSRDATKWLSIEIAQLVGESVACDPDLPFILMVLRGKVYLQRQLELKPELDAVGALAGCVKIFQAASASALEAFATQAEH